MGIYAIYYFGDFALYQPNVDFNRRSSIGWPIYIGKAIPGGGRKGLLEGKENSTALYARIKKHFATILAVDNLRVEDFKCKYLIIDSIWIPLGEQLLIDRFKPIWNSVIDGFGNNDPGGKRYGSAIPEWHQLHQGVGWVKRMEDFNAQKDLVALEERVTAHQQRMLDKLTP